MYLSMYVCMGGWVVGGKTGPYEGGVCVVDDFLKCDRC